MPAAVTITFTFYFENGKISFPLRRPDRIKMDKPPKLIKFDAESYYEGISNVRPDLFLVQEMSIDDTDMKEILQMIDEEIDNIDGVEEVTKAVMRETAIVYIEPIKDFKTRANLGGMYTRPSIKGGEIIDTQSEKIDLGIDVKFPGAGKRWDFGLDFSAPVFISLKTTDEFVYFYEDLFLGGMDVITDEDIIDFLEANDLIDEYDITDPKSLDKARRKFEETILDARWQMFKMEYKL